jgi:hypothetical protein
VHHFRYKSKPIDEQNDLMTITRVSSKHFLAIWAKSWGRKSVTPIQRRYPDLRRHLPFPEKCVKSGFYCIRLLGTDAKQSE